MLIINGRRINIDEVPDTGVYGRDILEGMKTKKNRRPVIHRGGIQMETIHPNRRYSKKDLLNKKGQPVKVDDIPDRTKGAEFGGARSRLSKTIITEQVFDVAANLFKTNIDFDEDNADWMVVPDYYLPKNWWHIARNAPLMLTFPTAYPSLPPIGFYLPDTLPGSANGHLYQDAYHEAWKLPTQKGWNWYCVYFAAGAWQPAQVRKPGDWRYGDNLWTYFTHVSETLVSED